MASTRCGITGGFIVLAETSSHSSDSTELRSEAEQIIWHQFTRARARSDWRDMDLILLTKIVKMEAEIRAAQIELDAMGMMVENNRGAPIPNPFLSVIDTL